MSRCAQLLQQGRLKTMLLALILSSVACVTVFMSWESKEERLMIDSKAILDWQGFGPEKGLYNYTVVTALLDIGRGQWSQQSRGFNKYLIYMNRVLRLDVNMVIFIEPKGVPMVQWMRRGRENRTLVLSASVQDVPYFKYKNRIQQIMQSIEYQRDNELVRKKLCEATIPEYDIVQWSKLYFLHRVIASNPFSSPYFVWMDAGYGRGEDIHPADGVWKPVKLFYHADRVSFLERRDVEAFRAKDARLHKMSINVVAGGVFGGGAAALERLYALQQEHVRAWMEAGMVDDDQTIIMQLYFRHPELFHFVRADWYDAFTIFNKD